MAKMKAVERNALPSQKFALPAERKYPINDRAHQVAAKQRASEMEHEGVISMKTKEKIDSAANKAMGSPGAMMPHEAPVMDQDNVMHTSHFKKGAVHPDSKGSSGMDGDGSGHWSGH